MKNKYILLKPPYMQKRSHYMFFLPIASLFFRKISEKPELGWIPTLKLHYYRTESIHVGLNIPHPYRKDSKKPSWNIFYQSLILPQIFSVISRSKSKRLSPSIGISYFIYPGKKPNPMPSSKHEIQGTNAMHGICNNLFVLNMI